VMPFLTEELWQRFAMGAASRPKSIALARYPRPNDAWADPAAESEVQKLQIVFTANRTFRAEKRLDPKMRLDATLYSPEREFVDLVQRHQQTILSGTNVALGTSQEAAPQTGSMTSTPNFDIVYEVPPANLGEQRKRLEKEREQLEKNIANSTRQLGDETFLSRAPAHVIESIKTKLVDYEAQLEKVRKALNGFSS
jgi:valyl-tRNA synthetase